jgi:antitoxin (DNA-binding transcriptional repressor) of toxin-antitoxin stability system
MATTVSIKDAKDQLTDLASLVERGETAVVTRNGKPIFDLAPHRLQALRAEAGAEFLKKRAIKEIFPYVASGLTSYSPRIFCSSRYRDDRAQSRHPRAWSDVKR